MPSVKNLLTLLLTVGGLCLPAQAQTTYQPGYSSSTECFKDEYREEYVPGTKDNPGYVRNWTEKVAIACASPKTSVQVRGSRVLQQIPMTAKKVRSLADFLERVLVERSLEATDAGLACPLVLSQEPLLVVRSMAAKRLRVSQQ